MHIHPHVSFNGQCAEAFAFYAACLGGRVTLSVPYSASPMADQMPASFHDKIMHARLEAAGTVILGSDAGPGRADRASGYDLSLTVTDPAEAARLFAALADGGEVTMPLTETGWAYRFGMLTDRFGVPWIVNCEEPG